MKEKLKNEKERKINPKSHITLHISNNSGITLVALIITIIVLLILALVAIQAVSENGIIGQAKNAQSGYEQAQANEQAILQNYEDYITGKLENSDDSINWEQILADATANPSKYKHPDQQKTNDIGIGTDGKPVNLDLWNYTYLIDQNAYMLCEGGETGGSVTSSGYSNAKIVDGKIQGKIPMYIKEEGKNNFYAIEDMRDTFSNCTDLIVAPEIPSSVISMEYTFSGCTGLISSPVIPNGVTYMNSTFSDCWSLTTAPVIPSSVTFMGSTFLRCTNLTGELVINSNPTLYADCLTDAVTGTDCSLVLKGDCPRETLEQIALTGPYLTSPGIYKVTVGK